MQHARTFFKPSIQMQVQSQEHPYICPNSGQQILKPNWCPGHLNTHLNYLWRGTEGKKHCLNVKWIILQHNPCFQGFDWDSCQFHVEKNLLLYLESPCYVYSKGVVVILVYILEGGSVHTPAENTFARSTLHLWQGAVLSQLCCPSHRVQVP